MEHSKVARLGCLAADLTSPSPQHSCPCRLVPHNMLILPRLPIAQGCQRAQIALLSDMLPGILQAAQGKTNAIAAQRIRERSKAEGIHVNLWR